MTENWKVIDDTKIHHVWRCAECKDEISIPPWYYTESGTPVCHNCDDDMKYLSTEIKNA